MAITPDWATKTFSVPQADLTLISGTLYEMDTETYFRSGINSIMAGEDGIVFEDSIRHSTEVTVAGTTFARAIEVINGYSLTFTPNSQWTVRLAGSNNNLFDVENNILNQNQVQVIAQNSAGLIVTTTGSGLSAAQDTKLTEIHNELHDIEGTLDMSALMKLISAALAGKLSGAATTTVTIRDVNDTKDRITATVDANGNRTVVVHDTS